MVPSSHVIGDVAYACDWLVLLARGRVLLSGEILAVIRGFSVTDRPDRSADAVGLVRLPAGRTCWLVPADERADDTRPATSPG
jgi:ABC-type multidrug transport system ATPase subunit